MKKFDDLINSLIQTVTNDEIKLLIQNNIFELSVTELMYIATLDNISEARKVVYMMRQELNKKIEQIIKNCSNETNLIELKKAVQFGQRNIFVLDLISKSETPYEIRKGFESGSKMTEENLYGTGFPAFNYLFAESDLVVLDENILIVTEDQKLIPYSTFKSNQYFKSRVRY